MAKFFTGDWHLSEKKAPNTWSFHRDFDSPEEMNDLIIQKINKYVGADDELYVLGDVAVGPECEPWLKKIVCKNLFLIPGEKDIDTEKGGIKSFLQPYFKLSPTSIKSSTNPNLVYVMAHTPSMCARLIENHNSDVEFLDYIPSVFGLHAHIHRARAMGKSKKTLNVGCDLWDYVPLSESRIDHLYGAITKYWDGEVYDY